MARRHLQRKRHIALGPTSNTLDANCVIISRSPKNWGIRKVFKNATLELSQPCFCHAYSNQFRRSDRRDDDRFGEPLLQQASRHLWTGREVRDLRLQHLERSRQTNATPGQTLQGAQSRRTLLQCKERGGTKTRSLSKSHFSIILIILFINFSSPQHPFSPSCFFLSSS